MEMAKVEFQRLEAFRVSGINSLVLSQLLKTQVLCLRLTDLYFREKAER